MSNKKFVLNPYDKRDSYLSSDAPGQMFGNVFCFIDDLTTTNDGRELEKTLHEIYIQEFEVKRKKITMSNKMFVLNPYDKRDSYLSSDAPSNIF